MAALALSMLLSTMATGAASEPFTVHDTYQAIENAGNDTGVSKAWLRRIVECETDPPFNPYSVGDGGLSLGAVQLHKYGERPRFYAEGYTDVFDPYQAVQYLAEALQAGRARAWSCR